MTAMQDWLAGAAGRTYGNFIGGQWQAPGARTSAVYNPADSRQLLGHFADSDAGDVEKAVSAAHRAGLAWREVPGPERGAILFRAADLLEAQVDELAFVLAAEQGKVLAEARGEVGRAAKELRFAAGEASRIDGQTLPSEKRHGLSLTMREPIGVVAAIGPWNFPVVTPVRKIGPALAFGCSVVLKTSNLTPWSAVRLMDVFRQAGVPDGVLNLVLGAGRTVGDALVRHPLVSGISFTGSTDVGMAISAEAGRRMARTQLELGGKNPAVVLGTADAAATARQIVGAAYACSGQRCTALSRVIVLESLAGELTAALEAQVRGVRVGPAWAADAAMGPLITDAHRRSVLEHIETARQDGARLVTGGQALREGEFEFGHFLEPTLFDQVDPGMRLARDEVFGPVLAVVPVATVDQAIEVANSVEYGLAASVYTPDVDLALRFARESQSGMVHVNHGTASEAHMPFGGVKRSGFGPYSIGHSNQEFFTATKAVYFQG